MNGAFSRSAGLIYGIFDEKKHKISRIAIPPELPRFLGLDFGGVNTAGVFFAQEPDAYHKPTGRLVAYREYRAGERSAAEHCYHLMKGEPRIPTCAGGSKSEGQWRREFAAGGTVNSVRVPGIPIHGPAKPEVQSIEVGINRASGRSPCTRFLCSMICMGSWMNCKATAASWMKWGSRRRRSRRRRRSHPGRGSLCYFVPAHG